MTAPLHGLPALDVRQLSGIRNRVFLAKLCILALVYTLAAVLALSDQVVVSLAGQVLLGLMFAHAVELQHQCLHNTAFRGKRSNRISGIALGLPMLVSFSDYQAHHLEHHRLLGTPRNKEFFNYGYQALTSLWALIPHLLMLRHYRDVLTNIAKAVAGRTDPIGPARVRSRVRNEHLLMFAFLLSLLALSVCFPALVVRLWLVPLLVAVPTHALIELPEHWNCEPTNDVFKNTRTIKAGRFAVWFTNGNNYHVEHHLLAGVPNDKLPELHREIASHITHLDRSYRTFFSQFLRQLCYGKTGGLVSANGLAEGRVVPAAQSIPVVDGSAGRLAREESPNLG
jgi:fatty acid desaturase